MVTQIQRVLGANGAISVDNLSFKLADAETYSRYMLRLTPELNFDNSHFLLIQKSKGSYEWLVTACLYITQGPATNLERRSRLEQVLSSGEGLDALYRVVLGSDGDRLRVRLRFLTLVLSEKASLPLLALLDLPPLEYFPPGIDILSEVKQLSPLLAGLSNNSPVVPRHSSFVDFLSDAHRSGPFYVDPLHSMRLRALHDAAQAIRNIAYDRSKILAVDPHDTELFVHQALRSLGPSYATERAQLAQKAKGDFSWAVEACRAVINPAADTHDQTVRLRLITSEGLDAYYKSILTQFAHTNQLEKLLPLITTLLSVQVPSLLSGLVGFSSTPSQFLAESNVSIMDIMKGAVYVAFTTSGVSTSAFWDFLVDPQCSGWLHIDVERMHQVHAHLAAYCLDVMSKHLCFNIADIPTSFVRNANIPDIQKRVEQNITPLLSYCCRLWPVYVYIALLGHAVLPSLVPFLENRTLQWLEVMSLTQSSPKEALAPLLNGVVCVFRVSRSVLGMILTTLSVHASWNRLTHTGCNAVCENICDTNIEQCASYLHQCACIHASMLGISVAAAVITRNSAS